ncbi:A/G-specific adenine glycosylase [Fimbriimonas ginsengisoli]|uniref:Adenine DNA glycosylase n=1 Tax=Fimbriimonas ginsengisoli Gsoil 348 TaxID=661478 RepID=A0A068NXH1_FIMGI|nr:A/G-specific adenine glycosylase [Fimbriimonas ginsengisoli]AIE86334.1 A/G-specific adenine glycosylase [Fimbriimonas ginsengisoli Gsoil 348]
MPKPAPPGLGSTRSDDALHQPNGGPLLKWYDQNRRDLPWRRTSDPYAVWVSEVMLQQTQVATVIPYWERWLARFPTIQALAESDEQEALSLWQGLGYYRRCRLLLAGARWVAEHGTPTTATGWLEVPGVGPYTAGAIASIAHGDPAPVVDGNVERVYARLAGDASAGPSLHKAAWTWARRELYRPRPGDWNQALMELGATVCKPVKPDCTVCPFEGRCVARQTWRVDELPTKEAQREAVRLKHAVWVPTFEGELGLRQIPEGLWWQGMWEFPRTDALAEAEIPELRELVGPGWLQHLGQIRHSVTHHRITIEVSLVRCETRSPDLRWFRPDDLASLPMPNPQRRVLKMAIDVL